MSNDEKNPKAISNRKITIHFRGSLPFTLKRIEYVAYKICHSKALLSEGVEDLTHNDRVNVTC